MSSDRWILALEAEPDAEMRARIVAPLSAHNEQAAGPGDWRPLAVTVRDAAGEVVGGLWGRVIYGFLFVELLALGPARGQGLGREAMRLAEEEARRRGLQGMWLDTWTFQAPDFYRKLGFVECGRITDYPPGHDRIFYVKRFA
ncbi:GNAT family N-acetyltransferase [Roseomonas marmotae]|uniref:GNAT family N-acetyltransferase n=1 Tax=Roseomonas marmotae TaxID=2768161 RepID=A0ABS3K9N9_9PROT|nr:GNAT family N-acetyltransferase [Roseomonas marmotae]MBO1073041.1 GNAT family N-acetyltransferase [Roseomonas marmotae]QTI79312.1 GNAT family N-acetyltransferase [Roseomonas marmotae]